MSFIASVCEFMPVLYADSVTTWERLKKRWEWEERCKALREKVEGRAKEGKINAKKRNVKAKQHRRRF